MTFARRIALGLGITLTATAGAQASPTPGGAECRQERGPRYCEAVAHRTAIRIRSARAEHHAARAHVAEPRDARITWRLPHLRRENRWWMRTVERLAALPTWVHRYDSVWDRLAGCESGGNWNINTGNGYYGGLQFNLGTWRAYGGRGYPHHNSKAEQIRVAERLRAARGFQPWPACRLKLGLR